MPTLTRTALAALAAATLSLTLTACGGAAIAPDPEVVSTAAAPAADTAQPMPESRPTGLRIPTAHVAAAKMLDLTTDDSGELAVPDADTDADTPGWWTAGPTPGERGAAVLVAHYDTKHGPALMKDVAKIKPGDRIEVPRADGRTAAFRVREVEDVPKERFPTGKVYGPTDRPELRLLTCGGPLKNGHRANNVIFYADLVRT
ncbi:class F sortase [Streptomyces bambusae]|uniref:class F sortase n=1 Tax=Streptomyces bambusae TaxID=1550616 RepID=UPI001CFC6CFA|nr:class F sortase [Streptomyces bambusae]MCB5166396.1 class F sortase [Streptomyces bambusae]